MIIIVGVKDDSMNEFTNIIVYIKLIYMYICIVEVI